MRANSKHRRDARYQAAVLRQIAAVDRYRAGQTTWMPAPVEEFLRPGDDINRYLSDPEESR